MFLGSLEGVMSVKMEANPTGQQELTVRAWSQNAVDTVLWTVRQKVEGYFARDSNGVPPQGVIKMI